MFLGIIYGKTLDAGVIRLFGLDIIDSGTLSQLALRMTVNFGNSLGHYFDEPCFSLSSWNIVTWTTHLKCIMLCSNLKRSLKESLVDLLCDGFP